VGGGDGATIAPGKPGVRMNPGCPCPEASPGRRGPRLTYEPGPRGKPEGAGGGGAVPPGGGAGEASVIGRGRRRPGPRSGDWPGG